MTFSIIAYDPDGPMWGAAVASKFLAAGALVTWARANAGAVATQALAKVGFGPLGLDLMASGLSAQETLDRLLENDPSRNQRQVACVDASGRVVAFTGPECMTWAGHWIGHGYACQGNILTGPETLAAMSEAFETTRGDLGARLVAALLAGDQAGGDRRGKQAAAVFVVKPAGGYGGDNDHYLDLRVDDDPEPVKRLSDLLKLHQLYFGKTPLEDHLPINAELATELQVVLARLGYYTGAPHGSWDDEVIQAFWRFIGTENLEERWTPENPHVLDPVILSFIRERFSL
jgi:uncharacterized Ntn-hydrolase superfamily protein